MEESDHKIRNKRQKLRSSHPYWSHYEKYNQQQEQNSNHLTMVAMNLSHELIRQQYQDYLLLESQKRNASERNSPDAELLRSSRINNNNNHVLHNNNNNNNNNNNLKRAANSSIDDVLKRLTSKMNNSTLREEDSRPTPSTTPTKTMFNQ